MRTISTQANADITSTIKDRGYSSKCKKGRYLVESTSLHVDDVTLFTNCHNIVQALNAVTDQQDEFITQY